MGLGVRGRLREVVVEKLSELHEQQVVTPVQDGMLPHDGGGDVTGGR